MSGSTITWFLLFPAISAMLSWLGVGWVTRYAIGAGVLDHPGKRQSHHVSTPTGGGLGMMASLLLVSLGLSFSGCDFPMWAMGVLPGVLVLTIIGWLDDRSSLAQWFRLIVQLAVSLYLVVFLHKTGLAAGNSWSGPLGALALTLGVFALMWLMNLYNFMDGSDGMAGFQGLFTGLILCLLFALENALAPALLCLVVTGCCLGFLPWNFPRPRVFMGDAGSVPLGYVFGSLIAMGCLLGLLRLPVAMLVLSVFLVDSTLTLFKRIFRGERWYTAHKQHLYQRLIAHGWPHSRVLLLYQAINVFFVLPVIALEMMYPAYAWPLTGVTWLIIATGWQVAHLKMGVRT